MRVALSFFCILFVVGCTSEPNIPALIPHRQIGSYAESDAGCEQFVHDLLNSFVSKKDVQREMHDLLIPDDSHWFIETFGASKGPILEFQYRYQLACQFARLDGYLPIFGGGKQQLVSVQDSDGERLSPFVVDSQLIPNANGRLRIYGVAIATNETGPWLRVGSFVYVDGRFRYLGALSLDSNWFSELSSYDQPFEP